MRLILRPLMPPRSLIELMYAIIPFPVLLSGDAGPLNGNVAPTFTSALVTPGVSARADAPAIVAPIAAASMDFQNIDFSPVRRRLRRSLFGQIHRVSPRLPHSTLSRALVRSPSPAVGA